MLPAHLNVNNHLDANSFLCNVCFYSLSLGAESFVFQVAIQKFEDQERTIILPLVLYGCETWSLALREEKKLRVFENMVLRRIFGPRRDGVTGEGRRLHNDGLNDLNCSPNIVRVIKWRRMRWVGYWRVWVRSRCV